MIDFFRQRPTRYSTPRSIRLAKFVQYVIAPALARAFDTHDIDAVVGAPPAPTAAEADQVGRRRLSDAIDCKLVFLISCVVKS